MIEGKNITLTYPQRGGSSDDFYALKNLDFEIERGRITAFIGRSGAGKTSLLKCVANLIDSYKGIITFQGKDIKKLSPIQRATHIGFVFQQFNLFPHMTIFQNCFKPLHNVLGFSYKDAEKKVFSTLDILQMKDLASSYPAHLSGGQQQRASIARALCLSPEVMLFDEPTSALDPESTKSLERIMVSLQEQGITIALSSHDMPFIKSILDKVYFLEHGTIVDRFDVQREDISSHTKILNFLDYGS